MATSVWQPFEDDNPSEEDFDFFGSSSWDSSTENGKTVSENTGETYEKDSIIFLIDCGHSMFEHKLEEEMEPFYYAIKCAAQVYADKIISSDTDLVGTVFYGTKEKSNQFDFENVYVYHDFDIPDAKRIKELRSMIDGRPEFEKKYGHGKNKQTIYEALWTCQHLFSHVPRNVGYKRIFLFTNDDNPTIGSDDIRKKCIEKAKDLIDSDITIELFVLKKKDENFNSHLFWELVIGISDDEYNGRITFDVADRFNELREKVRKKEFKKRRYGSVPLELGNGVSLSVSIYHMIQKAKKNPHIWLHSANNRPIKSERKFICEDTGKELMQSDIKYEFMYGGESVCFEADELMKLKSLSSRGFKLLGFKPRKCLKVYHNIKSSSFIYPSDNEISGSTTAFVALHKKMLLMEKVAICRLVLTSRTMPVYVVLLPQDEVLDNEGSQLEPPGFHVIYLPYADGIRKLQIPEVKDEENANDEQVSKAKRMIQKLNIDFRSYNFENPAIQKHYSYLQAMALEDEEEPLTDYIKPDEKGMEKYKEAIITFKNSVYPDGFDPALGQNKTLGRKRTKKEERSDEDDNEGDSLSEQSKSTKRRRIKKEEKNSGDDEEGGTSRSSSSSSSSSTKPKKGRVKREQRDGDEDDDDAEQIDVVQYAKSGTLNKLNMQQLKEFLKLYKLPVSGKKAELVKRVEEYLQKRGKI